MIIIRVLHRQVSQYTQAFTSHKNSQICSKQCNILSKLYCTTGASQTNVFENLHLPASIPKPDKLKLESLEQNAIDDSSKAIEYKQIKTKFDHLLEGNDEVAAEASVLASRRIDPKVVHQVFYFDTLAFAKKLEQSGFSREQAEGAAQCLVEVINTTLDHQGKHMVTKPQQDVAVQQLMSEISSVKKDMLLKSEFASLKIDTEKMGVQLNQINNHMNDEIVKLKGQFCLDINLERGRAIEAHAESEKRLQQLHNKIDTEVAQLRTTHEIYRNDMFKYFAGFVVSAGSLGLAIFRLWT